MRILVYGINYHPEKVGIGKYTTEMCEWLAQKGNEVQVITAMPFYPYWEVISSYKKKLWSTEIINNVKIRRCPLYVPKKVTGTTRIIHEISFVFSSLPFWGINLFRKFDAVICIAPPLQLGMPALLYKLFHKTRFVYHVQDLQLDAAKQLNLIKSNFILNAISFVERMILNRCDFVSTISEGMARNILKKNVKSEKIIFLKNWVDIKSILPGKSNHRIRELFGVPDGNKVVLYSGNMGEKQGLEILIPVAEQLKNTEVVFILIGEGAFKDQLRQMTEQRGLSNIKMFPLQPAELLPEILNMADLHLVLQKRAASDLVMPSKLTTILAVGGAAIVSTEPGTTLYEVTADNQIAIIVEPENAIALRDKIAYHIQNDNELIKQNARNYAVKYLAKDDILSSFLKFLQNDIER
jgi:colanic acid biosynthesis glycosyl transferase WcaI